MEVVPLQKLTKRSITNLNILGGICSLLSAYCLVLLIQIGDPVSNYYLGTFYTSMILTVFAFATSLILQAILNLQEGLLVE